MALVPEFISVLRDIRDNKYPQIQQWFTDIFGMNQNIVAIESNVEAIQADVTAKNTSIKSISVVNPVTTVPNQPNGDAGLAQVVYNPTTNQFTFEIPAGKQGKSMAINYTVAVATDLLGLTVNTGDIGFVTATSMIYVKLSTGTNTVLATDWSSPMAITPSTTFVGLSDTPVSYTGQTGKVPVVDGTETGLVFKTGAELGIIGYNYVKNPLFDNMVSIMPVITNTAFGADVRGYGSFTTFVGTPTLASDHARITNGVTIANTLAYAKGKSAIGIRVQLELLVPNSTIVNIGVMRLFINASSKFAITDGTTTNSLSALTVNTTDTYEIFATDQDLIVLNKTTGTLSSSSLALTVPTQTSGSIVIGGDGMQMKIYAITVQDKTSYVQVNGVYEEFAPNWTKETVGGEMALIQDIEGADKGMRFIASALPTESKIRMYVGDGGQFQGKRVTLSFTAYSVGVGANSIQTTFVTDRGSQIQTSRIINQILSPMVLDNGIEKNYSVTFDVNAIASNVFLDSDAKDYFEFTLPSSANYWINVKKPKFEISSIQTDFTPQGATSASTNAVAGATGGGSDKVFYENDQVITSNYAITDGKNAMSTGQITINDGILVTIPNGSSWVIL